VTPEVFYVTLLDVTDRKAIEAELAAAREREEKVEEEMRQTLEKKLKTSLSAAAIAHEINQPLSRVLLRARMGLEAATGADRDMLSALVADAERVVAVIKKMKVLLRNVETVQQEVDLGVITASALLQVKRLLRDAGVLVSRVGPESGCLLRGDEVQLQMIVINLLTNAIEAIMSGGGDRREVVVEQGVHDGVVELVVGDSGPGWPGGTLDEMLLNTTKPGGAGVGLYVVKTAVDNHRGQITIGRSPLGGAEFRIRFPRSAGNAQRGARTEGGHQRAAAIDLATDRGPVPFISDAVS
jgi:C4-dicarboxylate-specific signal transduction histidine kinase